MACSVARSVARSVDASDAYHGQVFEIFKFYQGKGYGEAAVRALCDAATRHKTLELEPLESNEGFWLKCGFTYLTSHCMTIDLEPSASSD